MFSDIRSFTAREASSSFSRFWDTVRRELLVSRFRSGTSCGTSRLAPTYAASRTTDYRWRLVEWRRISLNGHGAHI